MGGRASDIRNLHWAGINSGSNQTRHMRHIDKQIRTHFVGNIPKTLPVHYPGIGAKAGNDHFWFVFLRQRFDLLVINLSGFLIKPVLESLENLTGKIYFGAVGQVATMRQAHPQDGIARLQQRQINGGIGLRTRMRLDIGVISRKEFFYPINSQLLGNINILTAAIITFGRITFCVFIGQNGTLCFHHPRTGVIF